MSKRRTFTAEFKAKVILAILSGEKTVAEICRDHRIKETLVSRWKKQFLERAATVFGQNIENSQEKERRAELERMVGRLTMEVDILKKASHLLGPSKQRNV
jgi:transposase